MKTILFTLLCCLTLCAQEKQRAVRYYMLDMRAEQYPNIIKELTISFHRVWPKNNLSVVTNKLGTVALVKMDWGSDAVQWGKATPTPDPKASTLDAMKSMECDTGTHYQIVEELKKEEWDNLRETEEVDVKK